MIIAVTTRFLIKGTLEGYGYFTKEVFSILTRQHPEHQFYFLFDRPYDKEFVFSENVHPVVVSPPARHPVLWKYWYDRRIPAVLKKIRADIFISRDGYCSLNTKIPQCMVVHDLGFLHYPEAYKKSHLLFYKWYIPKYLKKATTIATVSEFSKKDLIKRYKINPDKIHVLYSAAKDTFQPVAVDEQEAIREKYTGGAAFFIYVGAIHPRKNLVNLLKAFSIFKKRQKSSMKLVLAGRLAWKNNAFLDLLKRYKYKEEVILTGYIDEKELVRLMGSAYALVYPSFFEGFGVPVVEAMKTNVPVLTSENTSMQEIAKDAGLFFNPADHTDIADKLMLIYKDEDLRNRLIENGNRVVAGYSWKNTAGFLWEIVINAIKHKQLP